MNESRIPEPSLLLRKPVEFEKPDLLFWQRFKVAEHNFRACFCLCNSPCEQELKKQTCRQQSDHFIYSTLALSVLFLSIIEHSVLMV